MMPRARAAAVIAIALLVVLGFIARRRHHKRTGEWLGGDWMTKGWFESWDTDGPDAPLSEDEVPDAATLAWCAPGLEPVAGEGCFAAPAGAGPWPLIVYLHGIFEPTAASDEVDRQARIAAHGIAAGFAVLALRGHVGQCSAAEYATRICWPSNERNMDAGPSYVGEWRAPLAAARRAGATGEHYVLGFSNGGYFSGLLAEREWFSARAFVVARGGPVEPVKATGTTPPILLTLSPDDPSHDEMVKLDEELTRESWPHEVFVSQGGHALPDADIDAAIAFFTRIRRGP
jgi:dienelactone hydrolase